LLYWFKSYSITWVFFRYFRGLSLAFRKAVLHNICLYNCTLHLYMRNVHSIHKLYTYIDISTIHTSTSIYVGTKTILLKPSSIISFRNVIIDPLCHTLSLWTSDNCLAPSPPAKIQTESRKVWSLVNEKFNLDVRKVSISAPKPCFPLVWHFPLIELTSR